MKIDRLLAEHQLLVTTAESCTGGLVASALVDIPGISDYFKEGYITYAPEAKEKIRQTIQLVGLDPDSKKHVGKYSLGMRQRLGLAQAIMEDPEILLLDEPMNGLDKHGVEEMRELFRSFADQGKTIIMANHSAEDIEVLCDTVHEMDLGVISRVK